MSSSSPDLSVHLEEQLHLPLQRVVSPVGVGLGSLHVADLDLSNTLAAPLLFQTDPEDRNLPLENVITALQPAAHKHTQALSKH